MRAQGETKGIRLATINIRSCRSEGGKTSYRTSDVTESALRGRGTAKPQVRRG